MGIRNEAGDKIQGNKIPGKVAPGKLIPGEGLKLLRLLERFDMRKHLERPENT